MFLLAASASACATVSLVPAPQKSAIVTIAASNLMVERSNTFMDAAFEKGWASRPKSLFQVLKTLTHGATEPASDAPLESELQSEPQLTISDYHQATEEINLYCEFVSAPERLQNRRGLMALERALIVSMAIEKKTAISLAQSGVSAPSDPMSKSVQCLRSAADEWADTIAGRDAAEPVS